MPTLPHRTHPTSQSQLRPSWHAPAALGLLGWAGGVCRRHVGRAGCQSHWAGALSQPLATVSHLSATVGGGGRTMFRTAGGGGGGKIGRTGGGRERGGSLEVALKVQCGHGG